MIKQVRAANTRAAVRIRIVVLVVSIQAMNSDDARVRLAWVASMRT
jgi:hypothetical protein